MSEASAEKGLPECNWPQCRTARGLSGCFAWCKCRCHAHQPEAAAPYVHPDDGHTLDCTALPSGGWLCAQTCPLPPAETGGRR